MTDMEPLRLALTTLQMTFGTYGRHIAYLTALSLVPAGFRFALFLDVAWLSGPLSGIAEAIVGVFRFILLYVVFRLVWPNGLVELQSETLERLRHTSWPEVAWQVLFLAVVAMVLNGAAQLIGAFVTADPLVQTAVAFGLKNLIIIPLWMVHLLVAIRMTWQL